MTIEKLNKNMDFTKYNDNEDFLSFKKDALKALGIDKKPKADRAFEIAWDMSHANGFEDVYWILADLAEIM